MIDKYYRVNKETLDRLNLEDVLKLLPKRVKFISIWHYLEIKRGSKKSKWRVCYGAHSTSARRLYRAVCEMLINLQEENTDDVEYRLNAFLKKGYIKFINQKDE